MVTLVYLWIIGCSEPDLRSPLLRLERSNLMCETFFFKLSRNQQLEWDSGGPLFFIVAFVKLWVMPLGPVLTGGTRRVSTGLKKGWGICQRALG